MKKLFVVSLLLISIFLIGNAEVTSADEENCKLYLATITIADDEGIVDSWKDCIEVCFYPDGWADAWVFCDMDYLGFAMEDLGSDFKNLVGASFVRPKFCHASLRGKNLNASCLLDMYDGLRVHARGLEITDEGLCPCPYVNGNPS